jgi:hypothetical protein
MRPRLAPAPDPAAAQPYYESRFTRETGGLMRLLRLVFEVDVAEDGVLRPRSVAAWRPEPARGESRLHRRLALLVNASDAKIAAFASKYGLLRRRSWEIVGLPGPESEARTLRSAQDLADNFLLVERWVRSGFSGDPPTGNPSCLPLVVLFATLPDAVLDVGESVVEGSTAVEGSHPDVFFQGAVAGAFLGKQAFEVLATDSGYIRKIEPERLRRCLKLTELAIRFAAGIDDLPTPVAAAGGTDAVLRSLTTHIPDAFTFGQVVELDTEAVANRVQGFSAERTDDWRAEAADFARICRSLDLILSALGTQGLSRADRDELLDIYAALLKRRTEIPLTPAELAERVVPLLVQRLQADLAAVGAWPLDTGGPVGLHVRALVAAWREITGKEPPIRCKTPGCGRAMSPARNRDYCDECRAQRRRDDVRRSRAQSGRTGEAR